MNRKLGMYSASLSLLSVIAFALSMIIRSDTASYISSMFIAWGIVPMVCSFASIAKQEVKAASYTSMVFAAIYGMFIAAIYFAQLTTLRTDLTEQAAILLDYKKFNLFFNYNLLGYGFMALSVFFAALTLDAKSKGEKWLKRLMLIHGVFWITGFIMPMLGVFKTDMAGGELAGVLVLEFWCAYFTPICVLSYRHFKNTGVETLRGKQSKAEKLQQ